MPREVGDELRASLERALAAGVRRESVVLDPGLGFAKRPEHSYEALAALPAFAALGCPLLVGPSRKSFLSAAIGERAPGERDMATAAAVAAAVLLGAHIVRVHNVPAMVDVVRVADAIRLRGQTDLPAMLNWLPQLPRLPAMTWWDILDIAIVSLVIYEVLKAIRGTRAIQMAVGFGAARADVLRLALGPSADGRLAHPQPAALSSCLPPSCCFRPTSAARSRTSAARRSSDIS